ncbi:cobalt transporter [Bacillus sp. AFS076308]|uniref:energy-coupling factor transporter transmembrane component T n=1 Tax=unclassified Bacillus (in: firmicutes) TaxID=185979 RepID=UPI000BF7D200|nr:MULTISPECIES: energy-coupling factor transporter transmembrane component T [unclassified Bacillus (in: firmicutes)]PFN97770.1 cobalt transporter [Bacillus sp. AFS076308]PGV51106.1 cobalt transporter [Bacillus sp. AFS037270]
MRLRFDRFHPLVTFLFYAGAVSLLILMLHPLFLISSIAVVILINLRHDRLNGLRRWWFFIITTFLLMVIMNPLFNERGRHLLVEIYEHRVTLEAVVYGGMNALSIIGIIALFVSYNIIMTPNKLLFIFAKVLPQFAVLLMLTLRFIPLMRRRLEEISLVQKSKGLSVSHGTWRARAKTGMLYVQTLLTFSLEEAIQTADSMKARGYGQGSRSSYEYFKINKADIIAILYLLSLFGFIVIERFSGFGVLTVYPIMESWHLSLIDRAVFICYIMFLSFPLLVEAGGMFRWRLSN